MILIRTVFQAKYGRGGDLVALFKEAKEWIPSMPQMRLLTDASGTMFTVVTEAVVPSLAEWERISKEAWSDPRFGQWFARMQELVDSGRREFWNIEA